MLSSMRRLCVVLILFTAALIGRQSLAENLFKAKVVIGSDGKPMLAITNNYQVSLTGLAISIDLSDDTREAEFRLYYDSDMDDLNNPPIAPGHTVKLPIGYIVGSDLSKLVPHIRTVVFDDGKTIGESVWTSTVFARRQRLLARMQRLHDLMDTSAAAGNKRPELLAKLHKVKSELDNTQADDEFRIIDDLALSSAISTIEGMNDDDLNAIGLRYSEHLRRRIKRLNHESSMSSQRQITSTGVVLVPPPFDDYAHEFLKSESRIELRKEIAALHFDKAMYTLSPPHLLLAGVYSCTVTQDLTSLVSHDNCGPSNVWDLSVKIKNHNSTTGADVLTTFDAGAYTSFGACWAAYTDCTGSTHSGGQHAGTQTPHNSLSIFNSTSADRFYWVLDHWQAPQIAACGECDIYPNGIQFTDSINQQYAVGIFYIDSNPTSSSCTVSTAAH